MKIVALFGAGKSAGALIEFLKAASGKNDFTLLLADADEELLMQKAGGHPCIETFVLDLKDEFHRRKIVARAQVIISLMPPALHLLLAKDCLLLGRHLLTASYVSQEMEQLRQDIADKGLLFLCEMGLDPGIDHMSAMKMLDQIRNQGGNIYSFKSWCGGLVAPENDDNPWHYKFSWNPRNVVMAGKEGAAYLTNGEVETLPYEQLFQLTIPLDTPEGKMSSYPNRNSLDYIPKYGLNKVLHFERSTIRHPDFMRGWNQMVALKFTDTNQVYTLKDNSIGDFFRMHFEKVNFGEWMNKRVGHLQEAKLLMKKLLEVMETQELGMQQGAVVKDFLTVDANGDLHTISIEKAKMNAAEQVADTLAETNLFFRQLDFLGWRDEDVKIPDGQYTAAEVLLWLMERKMMLRHEDRDWVLMIHEIEYELNGRTYQQRATLSLKGKPGGKTAMASTVGLPLGIAAIMLLNDQLPVRGLCIPTDKAIYDPVLKQLEEMNIRFEDKTLLLKKGT